MLLVLGGKRERDLDEGKKRERKKKIMGSVVCFVPCAGVCVMASSSAFGGHHPRLSVAQRRKKKDGSTNHALTAGTIGTMIGGARVRGMYVHTMYCTIHMSVHYLL